MRSQPSTQQMCRNCGMKPVFVEGTIVHPFCSRTCAGIFNGTASGKQNQPGQNHQNPRRAGDTCLLCNSHTKIEIDGKLSDFCSIRCRDDVYESTPLLLEIPSEHEEFREIAELFQKKWLHPPTEKKPLPGEVIKLYKVYSRRSHMERFKAYKALKGNQRRRWHGTTRRCRIGDPGETDFCDDPSCAMCSILQNSFLVARAKLPGKADGTGLRGFQRFGVGIYTSATSSKSFDYIKEYGGSPYKAMMLTEVVMGNAIKVPHNDHSLTEAPPGYDSVIGEPNITVNYDEAVVYTNDAIRPEYLVIFEPGE